MQRLVAAMAVLLAVAGCATTPQLLVLEGEGLGAAWSVKIAGNAPRDLESLRRSIQARVDAVSHSLSRWDAASSLSTLNASSNDDWQAVPADLFLAMDYAFLLARDTGGAFDPTVGSLVDVWGFGTAGRHYSPPPAEAVRAARERVGFWRVSLDSAGTRVRKPAGLQIDLSSMQHGAGADAVGRYLESLGIRRYLVDVGSEIRARGAAPEGGAWRVAVERPPSEQTETPANARQGGHAVRRAESSQRDGGNKDNNDNLYVLHLRDVGIATSGNYRYYFDYNGRRYSHRIDPRTGEPVAHALAAVTVIDPESMQADALATALTVLGPKEGLKYATDRRIAALFIERTESGLVEHMSPEFSAYLN